MEQIKHTSSTTREDNKEDLKLRPIVDTCGSYYYETAQVSCFLSHTFKEVRSNVHASFQTQMKNNIP